MWNMANMIPEIQRASDQLVTDLWLSHQFSRQVSSLSLLTPINTLIGNISRLLIHPGLSVATLPVLLNTPVAGVQKNELQGDTGNLIRISRICARDGALAKWERTPLVR